MLFIFARFKQAGFDLEIGRVKIDTSREGEGIGWIDREKGRNGVSGINNPYGCATIDNNGDTKGCETLATE